MSPCILLQFTILAQLSRKYKILLKLYRDKVINLLTFKIKYDKVFNGVELQPADLHVKNAAIIRQTKEGADREKLFSRHFRQ